MLFYFRYKLVKLNIYHFIQVYHYFCYALGEAKSQRWCARKKAATRIKNYDFILVLLFD